MRVLLPPDAFDELPDGYMHSTEPDDAGREEAEFPEYADFLDRELAERRWEREERMAAILNAAERVGSAGLLY